jgi:hypothetical protein
VETKHPLLTDDDPHSFSAEKSFSGVSVTRSSVFYVMFYRSLFVLLAIVLSVFRFMDSDYPFGIFKLFLYTIFIEYSSIVSKHLFEIVVLNI